MTRDKLHFLPTSPRPSKKKKGRGRRKKHVSRWKRLVAKAFRDSDPDSDDGIAAVSAG